ncbi:hypothetical protein ACF0H5_020672 [Mactra antiquata]
MSLCSFNTGRRGELSKRNKVVKTVFLVLVWVTLGLFLEVTGPTLIDLKIRTGADYEEVAVAVSGRSVGYFIGSAIGGPLVDRFVSYSDLMVGLCLTGGAIATVFVPLTRIVELLWFIIVAQGTFEGIINIAGQKLILLLWEKDAASPLHILHGGFGIGSFIIPLIANPFLAVPKPKIEHNLSNQSYEVNSSSQFTLAAPILLPTNGTSSSDTPSNTSTITEQTIEYIRESRIEYPYIIAALITLALSIVFYVYQLKGFKFQKVKSESLRKESVFRKCKTMVHPATCADGHTLYGIELFTLLFIYYFNIVGGERILGKFVRAYSIEQLGFSVDEGSYINTAFWISFAIGRISGFIAARYIPIRKLILIETGGVFVFSVLLNIFAVNNSLALWILLQPLAFFHAPCFPSGIGWADYHINMTGMAITFLLLGGSIGGVAYLKLTGFLFETYGARAFLYHVLGYGITCIVFAILLDVVGAQRGSRFLNNSKSKDEEEMTEINNENSENR